MTDSPTSLSSSAGIAEAVRAVARRHGFSPDAVEHLWQALVRGDGRMAQFDHPEFGGAGQWMEGGMTMVSTMFEGRLRRRVAALCDELADLRREAMAQDVREGPADAAGLRGDGERSAAPSRSAWWPAGLGHPASSGSQDGMRYAWFPEARRLVVESGGRRVVHDTGDHRIGGVSQQQGGGAGLAFTSQHGAVDLSRLPVVDERDAGGDACASPDGTVESPPAGFADRASPVHASAPASVPALISVPAAAVAPAPLPAPPAMRPPAQPGPAAVPASIPAEAHDPERILSLLERLADLQARGILSAEEFAAKKTELLARL